jgi:hypothetical protein
VFGGAADPCGQGSVVGVGGAADLVEQVLREPDGNECSEPGRVAPPRGSLRLLVLLAGVEFVFFAGCPLI